MVWVATLLLGLLLLLTIPVELSFAVRRRQHFRARVTIEWLFGCVRLPLRKTSRVPERPPKAHTSKRAGSGGKRVIALLDSKGFVVHLFKMISSLIRHVRVRRMVCHVCMGLDDPADTGRLWGVVGSLANTLPRPRHADVVVTPDFTAAVLHIDGQGRIRIIPIAMIAVVIIFLISPTTVRAVWAMAAKR